MDGAKCSYLVFRTLHLKNDTVKIEQLHRTNCESNFKWKNPNVPDIADIKTEDIIVCKIIGEWDVSNKRMLTYTMKNHEGIDRLVKE